MTERKITYDIKESVRNKLRKFERTHKLPTNINTTLDLLLNFANAHRPLFEREIELTKGRKD